VRVKHGLDRPKEVTGNSVYDGKVRAYLKVEE